MKKIILVALCLIITLGVSTCVCGAEAEKDVISKEEVPSISNELPCGKFLENNFDYNQLDWIDAPIFDEATWDTIDDSPVIKVTP